MSGPEGGPQGGYSHGMDVAAVRDIASRLAKAQGDLAAAVSASENAVRVLRRDWSGEDSGKLLSRWPGLREQLEGQAQDLQRLVARLREQAGEQDGASGAGGGPGGPGGDGPGGQGGRAPVGQGPDGSVPGQPGVPGEDDEDGWSWKPGGTFDHQLDNPNPDRDWTDQDGDQPWESRDYRNQEGEDWERGRTFDRTWGHEPEHAEGEHQGESRTSVSATIAEGERQLWDGSWGNSLSAGERGSDNYAYLGLHTEGTAEGSLEIGKDGLAAAGAVTAGGYVFSSAGKFQTGMGFGGSGKAYVGAEANANAGLSVGTGGVKGSLGGEAFVGGKAEGSLTQDLGPVDVGVGGELSYGLGAHAEGDVEVSLDNVGVSVDIGATLGIGAGVSLDVDFDPTFWN